MSELHNIHAFTIMAVTIGFDDILECPRLVLHDNGGNATHYLKRTPESDWDADVMYSVSGEMMRMKGKLVGDPLELMTALAQTWEYDIPDGSNN